jgi:hypothetical protein
VKSAGDTHWHGSNKHPRRLHGASDAILRPAEPEVLDEGALRLCRDASRFPATVASSGGQRRRRVTRCFQTCEYAAWKESTKRGETRAGGGSNVFRYNCQPIVEAGEALLVDSRPSSVVMMCRSGGLSTGKGHPRSQRRSRPLSNVSSIQRRRARAKLRPTRVSWRISRLSQPYSCTCCASPQISSAKMIWSRQACLRRQVPRIHQTLPSADRPD